MRCLFCKGDASTSRSVEHVIPESLGNQEHTLPRGVVCDRCNNYFSREVEKPFLESLPILLLRSEQDIPSKRGKLPAVPGIIFPNVPVWVTRARMKPDEMELSYPSWAEEQVWANGAKLIVPMSDQTPLPSVGIVSRFLAKVALEALALRILRHAESVDLLIDEPGLDPIRLYARQGPIKRHWYSHARQIYGANRVVKPENEPTYQVVHEFDILHTSREEWFFVLALFGLELVINYAGPEIDGYVTWLSENDGVSPLLIGRNANF